MQKRAVPATLEVSSRLQESNFNANAAALNTCLSEHPAILDDSRRRTKTTRATIHAASQACRRNFYPATLGDDGLHTAHTSRSQLEILCPNADDKDHHLNAPIGGA